jgi:hypothetical protein
MCEAARRAVPAAPWNRAPARLAAARADRIGRFAAPPIDRAAPIADCQARESDWPIAAIGRNCPAADPTLCLVAVATLANRETCRAIVRLIDCQAAVTPPPAFV